MSRHLNESIPVYYASIIILTALIFGGGTEQGLWTDHLVEVLSLPALAIGIAGFGSNRLTLAGRLIAISAFILVFMQFFPVLRSIPELLEPSGAASWSFFSKAPQRSLESGLFALCAVGFFLFLTRFSDSDLRRCLPVFYIGLFVNMLVGMVQLSYGTRIVVDGLLPFTIRSGLFANQNHLSSLVFMMIPLLAFTLLIRHRYIALFVFLAALIVAFLLAVGSRAGMAFVTILSLVSLIWFTRVKRTRGTAAGALAVGLLGLVAAAASFGVESSLDGELRPVIFATTWSAIKDFWLTGSGLGTFPLIYPAYEQTSDLINNYINHAHNDYLEFILETGLAGALLISAVLITCAWQMTRSPLAEAAFLSICGIALHSLVDYPLRTMAITVSVAYLAAILLSKSEPDDEADAKNLSDRKGREDTRHLRSARHPRRAKEQFSAGGRWRR